MYAALQQISGLTDISSLSEDSQEKYQEIANSLTTSNIQLEILKLLRDIKADLKTEKGEKQSIRLRRYQKFQTTQLGQGA